MKQMIDGAAYYVRSARPGESGYYDLHPGETRIVDNGDPEAPALFYKVPRGFRRAFRNWVRETWSDQASGWKDRKIFGRYGDLQVE